MVGKFRERDYLVSTAAFLLDPVCLKVSLVEKNSSRSLIGEVL